MKGRGGVLSFSHLVGTGVFPKLSPFAVKKQRMLPRPPDCIQTIVSSDGCGLIEGVVIGEINKFTQA